MSYQPEERYWTDYLRIALPVIGLLLLIGLLWYWASALIGDGGNEPPATQELAAAITPVNEATPAPPTATAVVIAPTPGPPVQPTPTPLPPAAVATQPAAAAAPTAAAGAENPCANMPVYPVGALVTASEPVNLRDQPTTEGSTVLQELPAGTQLQVTGEFSEAGQCDWWPVIVTETNQAGWVIEQFLQPVPA